MDNMFTAREIEALSDKAVKELIADAKAGKGNNELAEVIAVCIRHTSPYQLQNLNWFLKQRAGKALAATIK